MSDDSRHLEDAAKAGQQDEPTDEVEGHAAKAGLHKPAATDELAGDENDVEAHGFRHGNKSA